MTSDLPQIRILTREKFSVRVKTLADAANSKLSLNSDIFVRPEDSTWVSSSYTSVVSSNGKYVAVTEKSGIKVYDLSSSPAEIQGSVEEGQSKGYPLVSFIEVENVEAVHFSPDASLLISWSRRSGDKGMLFALLALSDFASSPRFPACPLCPSLFYCRQHVCLEGARRYSVGRILPPNILSFFLAIDWLV